MIFGEPLGYILGMIKRVYRNKLMLKFKENGIDLSLDLYVILCRIKEDKEVTQQDLADTLQKDKSIIMRQIHGLIERGYVVRLTNIQDKRKKELFLTDKGNEILKFTKNLSGDVANELLEGIDEKDQVIFEKVIKKMIRNGCSEKCCRKEENI